MIMYLKNRNINIDQKGYVTLLSVLVLGVVSLAITTSILNLGLGISLTSLAYEQSSQARALADACAEEALEEIRNSTSYTGTDTIILGQGQCSYTVTDQGGENRLINASGEVGEIIRKVSIEITGINPFITLSTWQEVSDF